MVADRAPSIVFVASEIPGLERLAAAWCVQFAASCIEPVGMAPESREADPSLDETFRSAGGNVSVPDSQPFSTGSLADVDCVVLLDSGSERLVDAPGLGPVPRLERWRIDSTGSLADLCHVSRKRVSQLVRDFTADREFVEIPAFSDPEDYRIEHCESLHRGFASVERLHFRHRLYTGGWSTPVQREVLGRGPAAAILLYDPQLEELVFIEQFRVAAAHDPNGPWQLEMVAGIVDPGETPEDVVVREAVEEAGCEVSDVELISRYLPSMGMSTESMFVFLGRVDASAAGGVHGLIDEGEDILVRVLEVDEAMRMMSEGRISNAATIIALQWFALNRDALRIRWLEGN